MMSSTPPASPIREEASSSARISESRDGLAHQSRRIAELERELEVIRVRHSRAKAHLESALRSLDRYRGLGPTATRVARRLTDFSRRFAGTTAAAKRIARGEVGLPGMSPPMRRLVVIGTPRAGNTWTTRLLGSLFGLETGGINDPEAVDLAVVPRDLVFQIHHHRVGPFVSHLGRHNFRVVVTARHPLDVLLSILHFVRRDFQTADWLCSEAGDEESIVGMTPRSPAFLDYATGSRARALLSVSREWWQAPGTHCVRYEDLVADTAGELERLARALGIEPRMGYHEAIAVNTKDRFRSSAEGKWHVWKGSPGHWRLYLPAGEARLIAEAHRDVFETLGYTCDPDEDLSEGQADANWLRSLAH